MRDYSALPSGNIGRVKALSFAENLERFFEISGVNQAELAQRVHVKPSTVTRWKKGEQDPSFKDFLAIARVFKVDPYTLAGSSFVEPDAAPTDKRPVGRPPRAKVPLSDFEAGMREGPGKRSEAPIRLVPAISPKKPAPKKSS